MRKLKGFTMIEMLMVVTIMAILMGGLMWMGGNTVRKAAFDNDKAILVNYYSEILSAFLSAPVIFDSSNKRQVVTQGNIIFTKESGSINKIYEYGSPAIEVPLSPLALKTGKIMETVFVQIDPSGSYKTPQDAVGDNIKLSFRKYSVGCSYETETEGAVGFKFQYGGVETSPIFACYRINLDACKLEEVPRTATGKCNYTTNYTP